MPTPVTFFVARVLLQDEGVLAGRSRHGFCPQSFMIRIFYIYQAALGIVLLEVWSAFRAR
jgi:hypothetical protein